MGEGRLLSRVGSRPPVPSADWCVSGRGRRRYGGNRQSPPPEGVGVRLCACGTALMVGSLRPQPHARAPPNGAWMWALHWNRIGRGTWSAIRGTDLPRPSEDKDGVGFRKFRPDPRVSRRFVRSLGPLTDADGSTFSMHILHHFAVSRGRPFPPPYDPSSA